MGLRLSKSGKDDGGVTRFRITNGPGDVERYRKIDKTKVEKRN